jgi:hypothetical protein
MVHTHTKTGVKRAQHHFPLRRLKRFVMGPQILKKLYSCTIESILTGCIYAWLGNCLASKRKAPEGSAYGPSHRWTRALCHPGPLYQVVSEEGPKTCQRLQPPRTVLSQVVLMHQVWKYGTNRTLNSFYPQAIRLLLPCTPAHWLGTGTPCI